jgi:O-antigen ligase
VLWPLAVFGGRDASTAIPFELCCILWVLALRPSRTRRGPARTLEVVLAAIAAVVAMQALPLPVGIVNLISPHAVVVHRELSLDAMPRSWAPFSIDRSATLWAAVIATGSFALFLAARATFSRGGLRQTVRGISALGLIVSAIAIAQAATAGRYIYWRFRTEYEGPLPFGPFVNRNHFATWVIMAAPLCFGYLMARADSPDTANAEFMSRRAKLTRLLDGRSAWLVFACALMTAALLLSLSRSGILALAAAATISMAGWRPRVIRRRWWVAAGLVLLLGYAFSRADLSALADRFGRSGTGIQNRLTIWRETLPIVRDFWITGTGAGTYRDAMLYYQRADRIVQFNQAHNHYLQVATEGGIVLVGLMVAGLTALTRTIRQRLEAESTGAFWIRGGAACGLLAVALQSLWETGLVMPANAALAAVLAAIACHQRETPEKKYF